MVSAGEPDPLIGQFESVAVDDAGLAGDVGQGDGGDEKQDGGKAEQVTSPGIAGYRCAAFRRAPTP